MARTRQADAAEEEHSTGAGAGGHEMVHGETSRLRDQGETSGPRQEDGRVQIDPVLLQTMAQAIATGIVAAQRQPGTQEGDRWLADMLRARPPLFDGTSEKDVEDWIAEMESTFSMIRCPVDRRVALAQHQLRDAAARWWRTYKPTDAEVGWGEFVRMLKKRYCPESVRNARARDFFSARQQNLPVADIVQQYRSELSYMADMVPTERQQICHLEQRLPDHVRTYASGFYCTTLQEYEDIVIAYARSLSGQQSQKKQKTQGQSFGGRSGPVSGQSSRPMGSQKGQRSSFSADGKKYCYNCGSADHMRRQCPRAVTTCFSCGGEGHLARYCGQKGTSQTSSQTPQVSVQSNRQPSSSGFRAPGSQTVQQAPSTGRGRGRGTGGTASTSGTPSRVFELRSADEKAPVASGTLLVNSQPVHVLFDTGATHSFVSEECARRLGLHCTPCLPFSVKLPNGDRLGGSFEIIDCPVRVGHSDCTARLIVLPLRGEDIILGMDWMIQHKAVLDIFRWTITVTTPDGRREILGGREHLSTRGSLSLLTPEISPESREMFYYCYVLQEDTSELSVESIPVVHEFPDVFPNDLPGLPPLREVDFPIELEPGTRPISKAPYRMAPAEMKELKVKGQQGREAG